MICIGCTKPVKSLYIVYSNNHIQLTECPHCHGIVDKYVEIDNILLFIDLLLLKPGAYRHMVFNSLEETLSKYDDWKSLDFRHQSLSETLEQTYCNIKNWILKFDTINRLWILLLTFEIYLKWMTEESKYYTYQNSRYSSFQLDTIIDKINSWSALNQYLYFAVYSIIDLTFFHNLTQYCIIKWYNWGENIRFAKYAISYTILLSYGAKIFPVLMLIWPYDDSTSSTSIIKWVANLYLIESLKVVTNLPYRAILKVFIFVTILKTVCVKPIMILLLTKGDSVQLKSYLYSEMLLMFLPIFGNY
ncbi:hypothetical protein KAFR_0H01910 [Kazachstania africana CBS 2517]|uniref:Protein ARV n=1 Tax=Kazachstania africana (strain ATCC 22294 / BCRC 22015 / CBS 2517 / CECT 1963 / NBRC 1671 / NRRL Y-8276) TaxID=1071382 RepID=H2AZ44_KAZAF|nr:hypothetical protein KAFR_0H01910 [Kazachstania africana CBS 2517]CCF59600.1 hypothetical protein KAFR_0H01910 [Kazachstania africana CBS 2517]